MDRFPSHWAPSLVRILNLRSGHQEHEITWFSLFVIGHSTVVEVYWHSHQVYPNETGYLIHLIDTHCVETLRKKNTLPPPPPKNIPTLAGKMIINGILFPARCRCHPQLTFKRKAECSKSVKTFELRLYYIERKIKLFNHKLEKCLFSICILQRNPCLPLKNHVHVLFSYANENLV